MVEEGIFIVYKFSSKGIGVDKPKIYVIVKLSQSSNMMCIRNFLRQVSFYRRFIKDFPLISKPLRELLVKYVSLIFFMTSVCIRFKP